MRYLLFYRESNDFNDILSDITVKKLYRTKLMFTNYLILGFPDTTEKKIDSYVMLKYGDDILNFTDIIPDLSPIPYKDYVPKKK